MGRRKLFIVSVMVISFVLLSAGALYAVESQNYTFEVKLLLNSSKSLDSNNVPLKNLQDLFAVKETNKRTVIYVESSDKSFNKVGWSNRIREKDGKKKIELTYKKRYAVDGTDINSVFEKAVKDNPGFIDKGYEAQVDWGYGKMTLSFAMEVKIDKPAGGLRGFSEEDLLSAFMSKMPAEESEWMFSAFKSYKIPNVRLAGPIDYMRYTGSYKDVEVNIEVWQIKGTVVTELSFDADTLATASTLRSEIIDILDKLGILLHQDSLKTQMILDAYI